MFVSQPHYEFPFPPDLSNPGSRHWRMVELTLHAPWFLLSLEIQDADDPNFSITRTLCIAWENDLAELLGSLGPNRIKGIVCMMPAWQSVTGQWSSRVVAEVWLCRSVAGRSVLLRDTGGEEFDCGLIPDHVEPVERELLLRVPPPESPKGPQPQPGRRSHRASARNAKA